MGEIIWNNIENKIVLTFTGSIEWYKNYYIEVDCCSFSGKKEITLFEKNIENVKKTNLKNLRVGDSILLNDCESDSYIKFTILDNLGKVTVNGKIGGSHEKNSMRFEFIADQTILQNLINLLKQC